MVMINVKDFLRRRAPRSFSESRGSLSPYHLERPAVREFPALSDYNIISVNRWSEWRRLYQAALIIVLFLPTIIATTYFGLIATPRYVAEAKFIVRTAAKASGGGVSLTSLLQITGLSRSQDDVFSVLDFMTSRDAITQLIEKLPLEDMYRFKEGDFAARYPSIFFGSTREQFYKYFQWMLSVSYSNSSGISTIQVQAFSPEDARNIADALLSLGEQLVNKMNDRIYQDAIKVSFDQVTLNEKRLVDAQITL